MTANLSTIKAKSHSDFACGICEKEKALATVSWPNHYSNAVHSECYSKIKDVECNLFKALNKLFKSEKSFGKLNNSHIEAIKAVRIACGSYSILSYLEKNGADALGKLFNTVGMEAAKKYASSL